MRRARARRPGGDPWLPLRALATAARAGLPPAPATVETLAVHKDGHEFHIELSLTMWKIADGVYFTGTMRDITQRKQTEQTLRTIIKDIKAANAEPLLMQIHLPANYGRRYNEAFGAIYPALAKEFAIPLLPFFMEGVYLKPQWMQDDGIHPNRDAQPFIADWMAKSSGWRKLA